MKITGLILKTLFSILALIIGSSIIVWVIYNEFIHRLPDYERPPLAGFFGIAPLMIGAGLYWARQVIGQLKDK
jgi:hypothetical protein